MKVAELVVQHKSEEEVLTLVQDTLREITRLLIPGESPDYGTSVGEAAARVKFASALVEAHKQKRYGKKPTVVI